MSGGSDVRASKTNPYEPQSFMRDHKLQHTYHVTVCPDIQTAQYRQNKRQTKNTFPQLHSWTRNLLGFLFVFVLFLFVFCLFVLFCFVCFLFLFFCWLVGVLIVALFLFLLVGCLVGGRVFSSLLAHTKHIFHHESHICFSALTGSHPDLPEVPWAQYKTLLRETMDLYLGP